MIKNLTSDLIVKIVEKSLLLLIWLLWPLCSASLLLREPVYFFETTFLVVIHVVEVTVCFYGRQVQILRSTVPRAGPEHWRQKLLLQRLGTQILHEVDSSAILRVRRALLALGAGWRLEVRQKDLFLC